MSEQTMESLKKHIDYMINEEHIPSLHIDWFGGEPFMSERFNELVLFCKMEGKQITLITNGTKAENKDYQQLMKLGVGLFEIPVHSPQEEIHDQMVQIKGSWKKSVNSIREIIKADGNVVPVIVITKHNVNVLGETLDFINHSLGCKRIMLNRYNIGGKGCANPLEVSASAKELQQAFGIANQKAKEWGLKLTSNVCSPICLLNPKDYPNIGFGHCSFNPMQKPITLDINGNVRLCNHSPVVAGNIYENKIEDILFSDYSLSWEEKIPEFCATCNEWNKCKGGCRAASEQCYNTLSKEDPIIKELGIVR